MPFATYNMSDMVNFVNKTHNSLKIYTYMLLR